MTKIFPNPNGIPTELKNHPQWVLWKQEMRNGKFTKVPYQPSMAMAKCNTPGTWSPFDVVWAAYEAGGFDGVGFVTTLEDGFVFLDLDKCRNPETGSRELWADRIIQRMNSYTELSPSGSGYHIIMQGRKPGTKCKFPMNGAGALEIYDRNRFLTITGQMECA